MTRLIGLVALAGLLGAQQVSLPSRRVLTLEAAKVIASAVEAEAVKNKWEITVAVVDAGGTPVLLHRMDGCQNASAEIATRKAKTAVHYRRPTKAFEDALAQGRQGILVFPDVVPSEGGVPVTVDGVIVGAVGVSGVTSQQDGQLARAGIEALLKALK